MNIYGVRGYLTPDSLPEDRHCRTFKIPNDVQWLSVFMGALLPLIYPESWQAYGELTPDEAADEMLDVIWNAYQEDEGECPTVPTPFWDSVTDIEAEYPEGTLTPWYGTAIVTYASPPEVTFVEQAAIWLFAGFIVYSGQPGAAIAFLTIAPKFVIALKTGDIGAVVDIIVDASRVGRYDTYSPTPGVMEIPIVGDPDLDEHQIYIVKDDDPDTTVQVVRDELNPNDVAPSNLRYDAGTDTVQIQGADGTWGNNVNADPRSSPAYQFPPVDADDPRCQAASNMSRWINNLIDEVLGAISAVDDAAGLITLLIGLLIDLGPFGILIDLVLALAFVLFDAGDTAISAAFTSEVYDQLTCIFYCHLDDSGQASAAALAAIKAQIDSEIGGLVALVLDAMFFLMGNVGLSNAGTVDDGEPSDCSGCVCAWCYTWDFEVSDGGFFNWEGRGVYVPGTGWTSTVGSGFVAATIRSAGCGGECHANIDSWETVIDYVSLPATGFNAFWYLTSTDTFNFVAYGSLDVPPGVGTYTHAEIDPTDYPNIGVNAVVNDEAGVCVIKSITVRGTGSVPEFTGGTLC